MSNVGLERALAPVKGRVVRTAVGDRYVVEEMRRSGYNFGGEQSGHLIFLDHVTTGDGVAAALNVLAVMQREGRPLSELARCFEPVPQAQVNVVGPREAAARRAAGGREGHRRGGAGARVRRPRARPLLRDREQGAGPRGGAGREEDQGARGLHRGGAQEGYRVAVGPCRGSAAAAAAPEKTGGARVTAGSDVAAVSDRQPLRLATEVASRRCMGYISRHVRPPRRQRRPRRDAPPVPPHAVPGSRRRRGARGAGRRRPDHHPPPRGPPPHPGARPPDHAAHRHDPAQPRDGGDAGDGQARLRDQARRRDPRPGAARGAHDRGRARRRLRPRRHPHAW